MAPTGQETSRDPKPAPGQTAAGPRSHAEPHRPHTPAAHPPHTACGHCTAQYGACRPACLRRPPAGVCLRRPRPHPHPKGTPRARSGTAPACRLGRRGGNHRGTHPRSHLGSPKVSPAPPSFAPPGPPDGPATRAKALRHRQRGQPVRNHSRYLANPWQAEDLVIRTTRAAAPPLAAGSIRGRRPAVAPPRGSRRRPRR
jgi:hypothetical protein